MPPREWTLQLVDGFKLYESVSQNRKQIEARPKFESNRRVWTEMERYAVDDVLRLQFTVKREVKRTIGGLHITRETQRDKTLGSLTETEVDLIVGLLGLTKGGYMDAMRQLYRGERVDEETPVYLAHFRQGPLHR